MPPGLVCVAVVVHAAWPLTPDVASVCPLTKPVMVAVNVGTGAPNALLTSLAVTVNVAGPTETVPGT